MLHVLDSAGEFGWQLERAGLFGDEVRMPRRGDSGSSFTSFDPGWQIGKAPGLREPWTTTGNLQEKQRKWRNELNLSKDKAIQTTGTTVLVILGQNPGVRNEKNTN